MRFMAHRPHPATFALILHLPKIGRPLQNHMDVSENSGVSPQIPQIIHFNRVFHYFHHPSWGPTPIFGNIHITKLQVWAPRQVARAERPNRSWRRPGMFAQKSCRQVGATSCWFKWWVSVIYVYPTIVVNWWFGFGGLEDQRTISCLSFRWEDTNLTLWVRVKINNPKKS